MHALCHVRVSVMSLAEVIEINNGYEEDYNGLFSMV